MDDPRRPGVLVSDFDGTVTRQDFFRLVVESFASDAMAEHWPRYLEGRCTHFEAMRGIFGSIRVDEAAMLGLVARAEPDPDLAGWVGRLNRAGWDVVVASAGCGWYIERVLAGAGVKLEVHASPGRFEPGRGLIMEMPHASPFVSATHGIDKAAVVRAGLDRGQVVAYAGDGFSDLPAARLVPDQLRFARADLSDELRRERLAFTPFDRWGEVAAALCAVDPARVK